MTVLLLLRHLAFIFLACHRDDPHNSRKKKSKHHTHTAQHKDYLLSQPVTCIFFPNKFVHLIIEKTDFFFELNLENGNFLDQRKRKFCGTSSFQVMVWLGATNGCHWPFFSERMSTLRFLEAVARRAERPSLDGDDASARV